jgi:hypothetical protein
MLKSGAVFPNLPLRASGFASLNDPGGNMRLVAAAEAADPGVVLTAASVGYFDSGGRMVGQTNLTKDQLTTSPLLATIVVPPGTYRVRVAATDSTGRGGATDVEVAAEMTPAGALKLSSLVLGLWRDNTFHPRLQFSIEPVAIAYLDVVGGVAGAPVAAFVESRAQQWTGHRPRGSPSGQRASAGSGRCRCSDRRAPARRLRRPRGRGIDGQPMGRVTRAAKVSQ